MKKLLFILILATTSLVQATSSFAQVEHHSILDGNPIWVYYVQAHKAEDVPEVCLNQVSYGNEVYKWCANFLITYRQDCFLRFFIGDTLLYDGIVMRRIMCEALDMDGKQLSPKVFYFGATNPYNWDICREEGYYVYGYQYAGIPKYSKNTADFIKHTTGLPKIYESLLFDFSLDCGDSVFVFDKSDPKCDAFPVVSKELVTVADGSTRYKTTYRFKTNNHENEVFIDGIGGINTENPPFGLAYHSYPEGTIYFNRHNLNCFIQNGKVVYIAPREGLENDEEYEGSTRFRDMPFYPDITPESVADGTYVIADDVNNIASDETAKGKSIYNLQGQRTSRPTKGIHIIGGRKVLVK